MSKLFGGQKTMREKADKAESLRGKTTKGTAEAAKGGNWKVKKGSVGKDSASITLSKKIGRRK